eukprot:m.317691 g.317691  ORF g.317691 m.317691 type:complete len:1106 (-) comp16437_c0_seq5:132-3449(-)
MEPDDDSVGSRSSSDEPSATFTNLLRQLPGLQCPPTVEEPIILSNIMPPTSTSKTNDTVVGWGTLNGPASDTADPMDEDLQGNGVAAMGPVGIAAAGALGGMPAEDEMDLAVANLQCAVGGENGSNLALQPLFPPQLGAPQQKHIRVALDEFQPTIHVCAIPDTIDTWGPDLHGILCGAVGGDYVISARIFSARRQFFNVSFTPEGARTIRGMMHSDTLVVRVHSNNAVPVEISPTCPNLETPTKRRQTTTRNDLDRPDKNRKRARAQKRPAGGSGGFVTKLMTRGAKPALRRVFVVVAMRTPNIDAERLREGIESFNEEQLLSFCDFVLGLLKRENAPDCGVFSSLGDVLKTHPRDSIPALALASKMSGGAFTHHPDEHGIWSDASRSRTTDMPFETVKAEMVMLLRPDEFRFSEYDIDDTIATRLQEFLCDDFYRSEIVPMVDAIGRRMLSPRFFDNRPIRDTHFVFVEDTREGAATNDIVVSEISLDKLQRWSLGDLYNHVTNNAAPTPLTLHKAKPDLLSRTLQGWDGKDMVSKAERQPDAPESAFTMDLTKRLPAGDLYLRLLPMKGGGEADDDWYTYIPPSPRGDCSSTEDEFSEEEEEDELSDLEGERPHEATDSDYEGDASTIQTESVYSEPILEESKQHQVTTMDTISIQSERPSTPGASSSDRMAPSVSTDDITSESVMDTQESATIDSSPHGLSTATPAQVGPGACRPSLTQVVTNQGGVALNPRVEELMNTEGRGREDSSRGTAPRGPHYPGVSLHSRFAGKSGAPQRRRSSARASSALPPTPDNSQEITPCSSRRTSLKRQKVVVGVTEVPDAVVERTTKSGAPPQPNLSTHQQNEAVTEVAVPSAPPCCEVQTKPVERDDCERSKSDGTTDAPAVAESPPSSASSSPQSHRQCICDSGYESTEPSSDILEKLQVAQETIWVLQQEIDDKTRQAEAALHHLRVCQNKYELATQDQAQAEHDKSRLHRDLGFAMEELDRQTSKRHHSMAQLNRQIQRLSLSQESDMVLRTLVFDSTWLPDDLVDNCKTCDLEFGCFSRKHHCRLCGDIFCNACSPVTIVSKKFSARLCRACKLQIQRIKDDTVAQPTAVCVRY